MTASLDEKIDLMKREIDALQIAITGQSKPWYGSISTILSVIALLFSFGTTYVSYSRTSAQDVQSTRQDLRSLLQRLAALPKENVDIGKRYADDPASRGLISGFINQENTLLARQAAELARRLPEHTVSGAEYYAVAVALQSAYDMQGATEFLKFAVEAKPDFNTEISSLRMAANLQFIQGHPEAGRVEYQRALDIFSKYPDFDPFTKISTNVQTELSWAFSEANSNALPLANQHVNTAESLFNGLPRNPGVDALRAQTSQAKQLFLSGTQNINPIISTQPGIAPLSN